MRRTTGVVALIVGIAVVAGPARGATTCTFTTAGTVMTLDQTCQTDSTIVVPDGMTLNGNGKVIAAYDPPQGGHFKGAVIQNGGSVAHVTNLEIQGGFTANVCDGGADRLRGIMFDGASGSITHSTVMGINQGPSGCQEGNAIEVRNGPFDGTHPATKTVSITHNTIVNWQKGGIICNGDVGCDIRYNDVGASATQENLAPNSIQFGFGANGGAFANAVDGNQWKGPSDYVGTAILIYLSDGVVLDNNWP